MVSPIYFMHQSPVQQTANYYSVAKMVLFFFPEKKSLSPTEKYMHILITSLSINNQIVLPDSIGVLKKPVEEISDLDLPYNENN